MYSQEIEIVLGKTVDRRFAAGQHAEADLVKAHRIADFRRQLVPRQRVGHIQRNNQPIIRHRFPLRLFRFLTKPSGHFCPCAELVHVETKCPAAGELRLPG